MSIDASPHRLHERATWLWRKEKANTLDIAKALKVSEPEAVRIIEYARQKGLLA